MKRRYAFLIWALLGLGTACLKDPEAPMNQPDTPTISVDEPSVARVSMLVKGSFGHKLEDITSYGVEFSDVLFEKDGTYTVLTPQEVTEDGFSLGITNLTPNKTYYLRSFISNGHSSLYSSVLTQKMPETSVASVSDVSLSADGNYLVAMIEDDGGRSVEDVGFVWGDTNDRRALRREKRYPATIGLDGRTFTLPVSALGNKTRYVLAYAEDDKEATGFSRIALERFVAEDEPSPTQPYNEIWYTSVNDDIVEPRHTDVFNTRLVSNTYKDGKGIMVFEEPLTSIGRAAFFGCNFTSIQLPDALQEIEAEAFGYCQYLESINIPQSVNSISDQLCFGQCKRLASFNGKFATADHRALIVDDTMVGFAPFGLTEYTVESNVRILGGVFQGCNNLEIVVLPEGLESIKHEAFEGCTSLLRLDLPSTLKYIGSYAFHDCIKLTHLTIPENVARIEKTAFDNCNSLQSFAGHLTSEDGHCLIIDNEIIGIAIAGLDEYTIPEGVTTTCHVMGFTSLKSIAFPETLTTIGQVYECYNLESIIVKTKIPPTAYFNHLPNYEFHLLYLTNDCPIYVPVESLEAYKTAEYWSVYADRIQPIVEGQLTNEIWYTTVDDTILNGYNPDCFNVSITSNSYEDGKGVLTFESPLTSIVAWGAFQGSNLKSIQLPGALENLGEMMFVDCPYLESIEIPESVTSLSYWGTCLNCPQLSSFSGKFASSDHRALIIDGTMNSFAPYGLTEYTVPTNVSSIGYSVFRLCRELTSVILTDNIKSMGVGVFSDASSLRSISLPSSLTSIPQAAFGGCTSLITIHIPENIIDIGPYAFDNCTSLSSFTGKYASQDGRFLIKDNTLCGIALSGMEEVIIPDGIQSACSIFYAQELKRVVYPESITSMGHVYECQNLNEIVVRAINPPRAVLTRSNSNGDPTFLKESNNCPIYVPAESVEAYKTAEYWSAYANRIQPIVEGQPTNEIWYTSSTGDIVEPAHSDVFNTRLVSNTYENGKGVMVFEDPLTIIGGAAFWGCDFTSIQLPGALQTIDEQAFGACMHLETIDIPESVSSISEFRVFSQCPNLSSFTGKFATQDHRALIVGDTMVGFAPKGLTEYTVESGVKVIGAVFESCTNLSSINLPEGLEEIGAEAFEWCSALQTIDLPTTVKSIGTFAFVSCNSLKTIDIPQSVISVGQDVFSNCLSLESFTGRYASEEGHYLIINNELVGVALAGVEECNIPEGVVSICNIWSLNNLKRITLPETITQISHIGYCTSLESIVIKAITPPYFKDDGSSLFDETNNCPIYVPANSVEAYKSAEYWSEYADRIQAIQ